jgi:hypothetical protein
VILVSCAPEPSELAGTYKSEDPNLIMKGWKYAVEGYEGFLTGTELELKTDSTFQMVTCSNILTGTWKYNQDSLYLTYQTNRWRSDSLQKFGLDGKWPELTEKGTEVVEINGNQLITGVVSTKNDGGVKLYHVLEK